MNEYATPDGLMDSLVKTSGIQSHAEILSTFLERGGCVDPAIVNQIIQLMTPQEVLDKIEHNREVISTNHYGSFDDLLRERMRIRNLELVPIRDEQSYARYMDMPRELFIELVRTHYVNTSKLSLVTELFPSDLPHDVDQRVIWIRDTTVDAAEIAEFIGCVMLAYGLTLDDIIFFERSRISTTEFVRAAVPEFRHIHVWMRKGV